MTKQSLALSCTLEERETPTSFLSRLAARNGISSASEFSSDIGISWKSIMMGHPDAVARLADISGANEKLIQQYTYRSVGPAQWIIGDEKASNKTVARTRVSICPQCVMASVSEHGYAGAFCRADWHFLAITACEIHHTAILRFPPAKYSNQSYDVASIVQSHWREIETAARVDVECLPTRLEQYLRKRLSGWKDTSWLHQWPLPVALRASELLGIRTMYGRAAVTTKLTEVQLQLARETGFDILNAGPRALTKVLERFFTENRIGFSTHHQDMGAFFAWLTREHNGDGINELRDFVRDFILDNYAVPRGTVILGQRIDNPNCFSLQSIELDLGIRQERMLNLLAELDPTVAKAIKPPRYLTKHQVKLLESRIADDLSMIEASRIMGCSYAHVDAFVKAGMLVRHSNGADAVHLSAEEIRAFVAPICKLEAIGNNADLVPITKIYSHCQRRICETYRCFLDGKLQRAYSNPDVNGLSGLMVDSTEVLNALSGGVECEHPRLCEVMTALHTDARTLRTLAGQNMLRLIKEQHPRTRFMRTYVDKHTLEKFNKSYITLGCLAKIAQTTTTGLSSKLDAAGVKPVFPMHETKRLYLKNDVKDYYKSDCE